MSIQFNAKQTTLKIMLKLQFLIGKKYNEEWSTVKNCNFSKLQFFKCNFTVISLHIFAVYMANNSYQPDNHIGPNFGFLTLKYAKKTQALGRTYKEKVSGISTLTYTNILFSYTVYILDFDSNIVLTPYSKAVKLDRWPRLALLPSKDGYVKPISILKGK